VSAGEVPEGPIRACTDRRFRRAFGASDSVTHAPSRGARHSVRTRCRNRIPVRQSRCCTQQENTPLRRLSVMAIVESLLVCRGNKAPLVRPRAKGRAVCKRSLRGVRAAPRSIPPALRGLSRPLGAGAPHPSTRLRLTSQRPDRRSPVGSLGRSGRRALPLWTPASAAFLRPDNPHEPPSALLRQGFGGRVGCIPASAPAVASQRRGKSWR
jgi:hypothetical protein